MGRVGQSLSELYLSVDFPSSSSAPVVCSRAGSVPFVRFSDGVVVSGSLGPLLRRSKGDFLRINDSISVSREQIARRRSQFSEAFASLSGDSRQWQDFVDSAYQGLDREISDLETQLLLYPNSVQSRVLDFQVAGLVHLKSYLVGLSDPSVAPAPLPLPRGDFGYVPPGGQYGRRVSDVRLLSVEERRSMRREFERARLQRAAIRSRIADSSSASSVFSSLSSRFSSYLFQADLYSGSPQRRDILREAGRDRLLLLEFVRRYPELSVGLPEGIDSIPRSYR